jgi:putative phosphoribosyl transferase
VAETIFQDRIDAGNRLTEAYGGPRDNVVVLGIARGGIPVGYPLALALDAPLDVVTARKLPVPWSPEAGFGAIAPDGSMVLNPDMAPRLGLSREEIDSVVGKVLVEVERREKVYRAGRPAADTADKNVVIVDDGLATGYTMIASIEMARKQEAGSVNVIVPVGPEDTARKVKALADYFLCLHTSRTYSFAVASFYVDFHDMRDQEVLEYLEKAHARGKK